MEASESLMFGGKAARLSGAPYHQLVSAARPGVIFRSKSTERAGLTQKYKWSTPKPTKTTQPKLIRIRIILLNPLFC